MNDTNSNMLAGHAAAALARHKQHVERSMARIVENRFDSHDLAAVHEARELLIDLTKRHPFALNAPVILILNDVLHLLQRVENHVNWGQDD